MQSGAPPPASALRGGHHRRTQSECGVAFRFHSDDNDTSRTVGMGSGLDEIGASEDDLFSSFMDMDKIGESENGYDEEEDEKERKVMESVSVSRPRHRQCRSVDGVSGGGFGVFCAEIGEAKKAMAADKLAELASIDPKRAKRILANRQSAARSKERKARYILELERKVQTLQTEATTLSAQLTLYQRDTTGLSTENVELKLRLQAMEQQAQLRDALNDALKQEVERLKFATGEASNHSENFNLDIHHMSFNSPFFSPQQPHGQQQAMQLSQQLCHSPLNMVNQQFIPHSNGLSDIIQQDSLGRLQGLDINQGLLHLNKPEKSTSASESSSTV